jgi:magnesium transporter
MEFPVENGPRAAHALTRMIRSFVFSQGKLISQDPALDFLKMVLFDEDAQIWVDLDQPTGEETKNVLESVFSFHPLSIEDCVAPSERPKIDEYDGYLFMVIHAVDFSSSLHQFQTSELNMFIGKNFLVTCHDKPMRSVTATVDRVLKNSVAVARAPDRLTYHILDLLLDNYDPALEDLAHEFDELEGIVMEAPSADILGRVMKLKAEVRRLRMIMMPQREVIARLARGEFKLVRNHLLPYYRDLLDRLVRIGDLTDNYRDQLTDTLQIHLNIQQMQVNRVIKVLTVLATLSVPLVAVTSYYGMNFRHFTELDLRHPHEYVWAITLASTGFLFLMLKRKKWL